jgi:SsrA-binding protein
MAAKTDAAVRVIAQNRKARHNYHIEDSLEAGIVLSGSEVKSLREGRGNIQESYATEQDGEIFLVNAYIPEYRQAGPQNHEPRRARKLLLNRREISRLIGAVQREGMTLVPLQIYFNARGLAKVELALARGKRQYDKREAEKQRDWQRQKARLMRERG